MINRAIAFALWSGFVVNAAADENSVDKSDYTIVNPTPDAQLRSFNTDRPPKANSPYTVDAGHFQYETDVAVFGIGNADGSRTHQWTVVDPTLKVGVTNSIDAEVQITPYESVSARSATGASNASGVGDTVARLKVNLAGNDGGALSVALLPYLKIPSAPSSLGDRAVESGMILPISFSTPAGFTVIVMPEGDYLKNSGHGGYHTAFYFLVNVSHALDKRWTLYTELFTFQPFSTKYAATYTLDEALTCLITSSLQIDLGGNFALNGIAPKVQLYGGLSQRF